MRARPIDRKAGWLAGVLLFALVVAAHLPATGNGFIWDDDSYLTENPIVQSPGGLRTIWIEPLASPQYYPLVFSTFWLEHRLWGLEPAGYHWVNVLLHAGTSVLVWMALLRLSVPGAWLAALWFGIHPVHVESVAWITERKNVLSGFLYLASILACLRAFRLDGRTDAGARGGIDRRAYASALFLFAGALMAKTVTATLPLAVVIVYWWKRGSSGWPALWKSLSPFLALGAAAGGATAWLEAHHVGAKGPEWSFSAAERLLVAGRAVWFYAGKILWPADLVFIYPRWRIDAGDPAQYLPPLGAVALVLILWRLKDRIGRGPLAAACYSGVTLAPALGFLNVFPMRYSFVADHFQYLASIGLLALLAAAATRVAGLAEERWGRSASIAATVAAILVSASLAGLSWRQAEWYKDARTLWERTATKNPSAPIAHWHLVEWFARGKQREEALRHLMALRRLTPGDPEVPIAIGTLFGDWKRPRAAIPWFESGLRLKPGEAVAMNGLGDAHSALGEYAAAERWYRRAAGEITANDNEVAYACEGLGVLSARAGKTGEALRWFEEGLRASAGAASLHYNRALLLGRMGKADKAIAGYLEALRIDPGHLMSRLNLAEEYAKSGDPAKAAEGFREVERRSPGKAEALYARGRLLEMEGKPGESGAWFRRALEAPTDHPQVREVLGKRFRR